MKRAAREDAWRRVGHQWPDSGPSLGRIEIVGFPGFMDGEIEPHGALTILCGVNASGKTRFLNAIADAVDGASSSLLSVQHSGIGERVLVDTFWLVQRQRLSLHHDAALDERVDQAGLSRVRADQLTMTSYLLGRDYSWIEVAELDATDDSIEMDALTEHARGIERALSFRADVIPYFQVARDGRTFTSLQLSQGELAGLTLVWALNQLQKNTLVLIDEPEAFMSPLSAERVLDVIAYYSHKNSSPGMVATHSYLGIVKSPSEHVVLFDVGHDGRVVVKPGDPVALWRTLRLAAPKPLVLAVEDRAAEQWLRNLLVRASFEHYESCSIIKAGDASAVRRAAGFPRVAEYPLSVYGFLDGDERDKGAATNCFYLPGPQDPDDTVLRAVTHFASEIDVDIPEGALSAALSRFPGGDRHERVDSIAHELGHEVGAFRSMVLHAWGSRTEEGRAAIEAFRSQLDEVLPPGS